MKRTLSILLVLSMLLTCCLTFTSCSKVKAKDFDKDAFSALKEISDKTYEEFLTDDAGMGAIIRDALKSGSVSFGFEGDADLIGMDLKLDETIYFDDEDKEYVSDTSVQINGETLAARLFVDENGIAVSGRDILGSDRALSLNFTTFINKFAESQLKDIMFPEGISSQEITEFTDAVKMLKEEYEKLFADDAEEQQKKLANEIYDIMKMDVSEEKITLENGKSGKGLIIKFTINNKVIKSLIDKFFDEADLPDDYLGNMSYSIEALKSQLDLLDINCTLKLYVNKKTAKTVKQVIDVKVGPKDEPNEKLDAKIVTTFSDTEIKTTFDAEGMDDKLDGEIKLTKETDKNKTVYKLTVNAGDGNGATVNFLNVSYTYNKSSGDITLVADIYSNERDRIEITLSGSITVTKSVAKIQINSLSFNGETYEFKLYLTFDKSADMPDRPANTKDVVTLTEEDIAQIAEEVSSSKLFSFIGRFEGNANKDELLP